MLTTTTRANNVRGVFDARARRFRVRRRLANETRAGDRRDTDGRAREIDDVRRTTDEVGL